MNATIRFLAAFCREHPLDEKVFICPSFVTGRQIGEALARGGRLLGQPPLPHSAALAAEILTRPGRTGGGPADDLFGGARA